MAPYSSTLAWKTTWTEEPGRLKSMGLLVHDVRECFNFIYFTCSCPVFPAPLIEETIFSLLFILISCAVLRCSVGSSVHGDSPSKNTGGGCHAFLQGLFPTQESNPGLPYCRQILYYLSHQQRSPRILEWGSLSCFQGTFPTQESNQGLLLCRWILYHQTIHLYYYT